MRSPILTGALIAATTLAVTVTSAPAIAEPVDWTEQRVLNIAHAGGEKEAPMNTLYAFRRAVAIGADMIELDVHATADGQLVVIHNATVEDTTDGTGAIADMSLDQVQALDAAYDFGSGQDYPFRGVRTGDAPAPGGYGPDDFAVPTLGSVLEQFPDTPINIEIKGRSDDDTESFRRTAKLLAAELDRTGRTEDVIVASFNDAALATFHDLAPSVGLAPGLAGITSYFLTGARPIEGTVALQIPVQQKGISLATPEFIRRAHDDGYVVYIWFSGTAPDDKATYSKMLDTCADGLMPAYPTVFEDLLDERDIVRPGVPGTDPCG